MQALAGNQIQHGGHSERKEQEIKIVVANQSYLSWKQASNEDCGGIWGYSDLLQAIQDPKHVEHAQRHTGH